MGDCVTTSETLTGAFNAAISATTEFKGAGNQILMTQSRRSGPSPSFWQRGTGPWPFTIAHHDRLPPADKAPSRSMKQALFLTDRGPSSWLQPLSSIAIVSKWCVCGNMSSALKEPRT